MLSFVSAGEFDACNASAEIQLSATVINSSNEECTSENGNYDWQGYDGEYSYWWDKGSYTLGIIYNDGSDEWASGIYSSGWIFGNAYTHVIEEEDFIEPMFCNNETGILNGIFNLSGYEDCSGKTATVILGSFSPKVNVWLKPDFFEKYANGSQVNYTDVFPPVLNCTAYVKDPDGEDTDEIKLNFTFIAKSTIYGNRTLYTTEILCQNKHNCSIILPEQNAKSIYPEDKVICNVTPTDNENNIGGSNSSNITMPSFDLFIKNIAAINVIEDVSLVANKSLIVRVWAFFNSNLITHMDKNVYVKLNSSLGDSNWTSFKPMKNFSLETIKNNVKAKPENPDAKDMEILNKVKRGEDSANFFSITNLKIPPSAGNIIYGATVDSPVGIWDTYNESNESNNYFSKNFEVVETKEINILIVRVNISDVIDPGAPLPYIIRNSYSPKVGIETVYFIMFQLGFLEGVYPCSIKGVDFSVRYIYTPLFDGVNVDKLSERKLRDIRELIFSDLHDLARKKGADVVVGLVDKGLLKKEGTYVQGMVLYNEHWYGNTGYENVILLDVDAPIYVMAHEMGHLNGLSDAYDITENGLHLGSLSYAGWSLDQGWGLRGLGPKVNVWTEPDDRGMYTFVNDALSNPVNYVFFPKTRSEFPSMKPNLFFGVMSGGTDAVTADVIHMEKTDYEKLLDRYKK